MKVTLKEWNAVATWRWDMPEDEVCGICRVQFDGTCPTCKFPGDDCSLLLGKCGHSFHMTLPAMSLPKLASSPPNPISSSPSRQSMRPPLSRPTSIDQITQTNAAPADLDHPSPAANADSHPTGDEQAHLEPPATSQPHILSQPFFTLIEDTHTSEIYHPAVHYIFSDDDTDIVTEAALRSLDSQQDTAQISRGKGKSRDNPALQPTQSPNELYEDDGAPRKESLLPEAIPGVRENYIILDVDHIPTVLEPEHGTAAAAPDAQGQGQAQPDKQQQDQTQPPAPQAQSFTVTSAHSLSSSWQVLNTRILPAPTFENNSSNEQPANGGLMLQIQGTSGLPVGMVGKDKERGSQRLEDMMDQFARRLDELRQVIECGERGTPAGGSGSLHDAEPLDGPSGQALPENIPDDAGPAEKGYREEGIVPRDRERAAQGPPHI
ncbi:anaphase-promoting complex subunit 11 RING-H2 finger-domain-containing protein [Aspergillus egyptiacus]|nr:anaphase-promoting complex subunit 11 RING-H2 finger-domain-containing protein [Aspergillus egyptiacus]